MTKLNKILILTSVLSAVLMSSGCLSQRSNSRYPKENVSFESTEYEPVFDIAKKKVSGTGEAGGFFNFDMGLSADAMVTSASSRLVPSGIFEGLTPTEADSVKNAIYNTCKQYNAEYLFAPHYTIETRTFPLLPFIWKKSYCTVRGLPASVKDVVKVVKPKAKVQLNLVAEGLEQ